MTEATRGYNNVDRSVSTFTAVLKFRVFILILIITLFVCCLCSFTDIWQQFISGASGQRTDWQEFHLLYFFQSVRSCEIGPYMSIQIHFDILTPRTVVNYRTCWEHYVRMWFCNSGDS